MSGGVYEGAWNRAVAALERSGRDPEHFYDAIHAFAKATEDAEDARALWEGEGKPWTALGGATGQAEVPHPLVKLVQDAQAIAAKYGVALGLDPSGKKVIGRPAGASSAPDRKPGRPAMRSVA